MQLREEAGWLGIVALLIWLSAIILLLIHGGILSAIFRGLAGLMAWTPLFLALRAQGKPSLSGRGRFAVAIVCSAVATAADPGISNAPAPVVGSPDVASAKQDVALHTPRKKSADEMRREWSAIEERNHDKIVSLIADEKALASTNVEGRLAFWQDITALAPGNGDFARQRAKMEAEVAALAPYREHPEQGGEVVKIVPHRAGFGTVLLVDITIRNRSLSHLKDFQIACSNQGPSGSEISESRRTLYDVVEARSTRTFGKVNMGFIDGQTTGTICRVEMASIY